MTSAGTGGSGVRPKIEELHIENYRALQRLTLSDLTPLTALIGPNGSGKSTVLDAVTFLSDCFRIGLRNAWRDRGGAQDIKTRGRAGPVVFAMKYRERPNGAAMTYALKIDEQNGAPLVALERLIGVSDNPGAKVIALNYGYGNGWVELDQTRQRQVVSLRSPDLLAANVYGQLSSHPLVAALRDFIMGWHISNFAVSDMKAPAQPGPTARLDRTGANLGNVVRFLAENQPEIWQEILSKLRQRVPRLESVVISQPIDGKLLLKIKDIPFQEPILARFTSDGTLKLLAYLVLLYAPDAPPFIGIEEPENLLHPRLMYPLAEELRMASAHSQLLITTHSPYFLDALRPEEVRVLYRDEDGCTHAARTADLYGIKEFMEDGALLGDLWMEGHLNAGDPLTDAGMPLRRAGI